MNLPKGKEKVKDFRRGFKLYPPLVNRGLSRVFPDELGYFKKYQLDEVL